MITGDAGMQSLTRRGFTFALASSAAVGLAPITTRAKDLIGGVSPSERLETMIRIMGRTDGGVAIRWTHGVLAGVVEQETTQLLGISQQVFTRHRRREDGGFDAVYLELVYFTDLKSGEVLEEWSNPYTDRKVTVPAQVLGPTPIQIPLDLKVINEPYPMEGIVNTHWLEPLPTLGDDVSFNERIDSYVPPMTEGGAPLKFHEVFAFRASSASLRNTNSPHVAATVDKFNVISWRPWMEMSDVDGVTMSRGAGRVIADYEYLPSDLAAKNEAHFPDVIAEIEDYLEI